MAESIAAPVTRPGGRRGRLFVIALLGIGAIALFAAIAELSTEKGGPPVIKLQGINDAQRIFGGIPSAGDRLGESDAPVSIQFYDDVQCSDCGEHFLATIPPLVDQEVREGDVQLLYRNYSFSVFPVQQGFIGVEAAGVQGYEWPFAYLMFRNQDEAERIGGANGEFLDSVAARIEELDVPQWEKDFAAGGGADGSITKYLRRQDEMAQALGLRKLASVIINGPNGTETLQDAPSLDDIRAAIDKVS